MAGLRKSGSRGFTLVEMIVVVAILAILASVAIPVISNSVRDANASADASAAHTIETSLKTSASELKNRRATQALQNAPEPKVSDALLNVKQPVSILTPVQPGYSFYYDTTKQTAAAYKSKPGTAFILLTGDTKLADLGLI